MKTKAKSLMFLTVLSALSASAQLDPGVLYHADFNGTTGTQPPGWEYISGGSNSALINNNNYRLRREDNGSSIQSFYTASDSSSWDNYRIETQVRSNWMEYTSSYIGLIARWDGTTPGGSTKAGGYYAFIHYIDEDTMEMVIWKGFTVNHSNPSPVISESFSYSLKNATTWNNPYFLTLEVFGPTITFTFSDGNFSHTISYEDLDDPYLVGAPGVRSHFGSNSRYSEYGFYTVSQVIPEPSTSALFIGLLAMIPLLLRYSRKTMGR